MAFVYATAVSPPKVGHLLVSLMPVTLQSGAASDPVNRRTAVSSKGEIAPQPRVFPRYRKMEEKRSTCVYGPVLMPHMAELCDVSLLFPS